MLNRLNQLLDEAIKKQDINAINQLNDLISKEKSNVQGMRDVTDEPYQEISKSNVKFIPTGFKSIDYELNDLETRRITIVTGRSGHGKSVMVNQILINAIDKGFKTLLVDGEHDSDLLINRTYRRIIGSDKNKFKPVLYNKKTIYEPNDFTLNQLQQWHKNKLFILEKHKATIKSHEKLFGILEDKVKAESLDLVILDNLMTLVVNEKNDLNSAQSEFVKECHELSIRANIHIVLVVHPSKTAANQKEIGLYGASGTSDLPNFCDNFLEVSRNFDKDNDFDGEIIIHKNRGYGQLTRIQLAYDKNTLGLYEKKLTGYEVTNYTLDKSKQTEWVECDDSPF